MARPKASPEELARRARVESTILQSTLVDGAWMLASIMRLLTTIPAGVAYAIATNALPSGSCIPLSRLLDNPTSHGPGPTLASLVVIFAIYAAVSHAQGSFILWAFDPTHKLRLFLGRAPPPRADTPPPTPGGRAARSQ